MVASCPAIPGNLARLFVSGSPIAFRPSVQAAGLEGVIARRKNSIYKPGKRSPNWVN
jgi:ATP-dependent DNA ligase